MEYVTTAEVERALEADEAHVVSVNGPGAFEREHIPGSINIPKAKLEAVAPTRFDPDDEIIVYCTDEHCQLSRKAYFILASLGFEHVKDYEGGLREWRESGHELGGELADVQEQPV